MSKKIAMIGAGSVVFSKNLTGDFLQYPEFADATFTYMDIDAQRLDVGAALCKKVADSLGVKPTIEKTMDQKQAIKDADFVICMVQVGGFNSTLVDFEIPRKYGLNFTIADTTGPGGLFRALRTFPFMSQLGRDIMELADKDAWLLQYSNPMSMNIRGLNEVTDWKINAVGLCHSVQGTFSGRMLDLGVPEREANFTAAGINHMNFFMKLEHDGEDLYPRLFAIADEMIAKGREPVRYEMMKRLGYFVTESSEHNAEYNAHFMPHEGYIDRYKVPVDEYLRRCDGIVDEFDRLIAFSQSDEPITVKKSHEYGSVIAHSIATGEPSVVYGNMPNRGAIPNLPDTAIVETPTLVDKNGCQLTRIDPLPAQLVNYMMPHVTQHELYARAVTQQDRDAVYQACFADPLTAATLPMDTIVEMCDEMIQAQKDDLPPLKPGRVPSSGKTFSPPTAKELRASWDQAKQRLSDEDRRRELAPRRPLRPAERRAAAARRPTTRAPARSTSPPPTRPRPTAPPTARCGGRTASSTPRSTSTPPRASARSPRARSTPTPASTASTTARRRSACTRPAATAPRSSTSTASASTAAPTPRSPSASARATTSSSSASTAPARSPCS